MERWILRLETLWTLHLDLDGGKGGEQEFQLLLSIHVCIFRICPGRQIAHSLIMLTAASILTTFDISKKKDEDGNYIEPKQEYHEGLLSYVSRNSIQDN